jgi:hypothetical protein
MRFALRVDDCQKAIVDALRHAGVKVCVVGRPLDLLCAVPNPGGSLPYRTVLLECKDEDGSFTKPQAEFLSEWPGEYHVVRSPSEALRACFGDSMK